VKPSGNKRKIKLSVDAVHHRWENCSLAYAVPAVFARIVQILGYAS